MGQALQIRHKGLYTAPNEFSGIPQGALVQADNTVINDNNILESRRGKEGTIQLPTGTDRASRFAFYQGKQIVNYTGGNLGYIDPTLTTYSGTFNHPDADFARLRFERQNSNLYFTTDGGIYKLDAYNGTPVLAGFFKALDIEAVLSGASGFLPDLNQCAYRVVWGYTDANKNLVRGAPSGREILINNAGGSRDASLTITIPTGITTADFFQVYRSKASGGVAVSPSDELGLVYENNPTAGEITAGVLTFIDATPDDLRGETLYTSPSQEGILQANERPPLAWDVASFEGSVVYANTESKQRRIFTILSVGGTGGIQLNDVITIAGTAYTAKAAELITNGEFALVTAGTPAQNIADTAVSLIRVINRYATNTLVYAYYLSGENDLPGQILIEERGIGASSYAVTASANGTAYNPVLPTSGTAVSSDNDDLQNQIMFSKTNRPEAVPLVNARFVGSRNDRILRIFALRNSLFIFKERDGIYRMTGTAPENFAVELFDSSARLLAPDSIALVNNQIWALSDQGIMVVTETGVSVVSRPIEDLILDQFGAALDDVKKLSFGVSYETDRKYLLYTVSDPNDTVPTQAFAFNAFTETFTRWPETKSTAFVNPVDDKLYFGDGDSDWLEKERKDRTYTDYVDRSFDVTLTVQTGLVLNLASVAGIESGDLFYESATKYSIITSVNVPLGTVTVSDQITWTLGTLQVYKAINCVVEYAPVTGENPGSSKQFPEISMLFREATFDTATLSFATDGSQGFEGVSIVGDKIGTWGSFPWGGAPWGGTTVSQPIRTYVPLEKQRGSFIRVKFEHRQAYGNFRLNGFSMPLRDFKDFKIAK